MGRGKQIHIIRLTSKQLFSMKINKAAMEEVRPPIELKDITVTPVVGTSDEVAWPVMEKKKSKPVTYRCSDRAAFLTDVAWSVFKAKEGKMLKFEVSRSVYLISHSVSTVQTCRANPYKTFSAPQAKKYTRNKTMY